nr:26S proteasome, beta-1 SU [Cryptomonas curvata]
MYLIKQSLGTTLIGIKLNNSIIIAADSQTSSGSLINNRVAEKLSKLNDHIVCSRSGAAADTQHIVDYLECLMSKNFNQTREPINVRAAVQILREICYKNKNANYGFICGGWDRFHGAQLYSINQGGALFKQPFLLTGSGSIYISSFCEANYREDMSYLQSRNFIIKAISMAMNRDSNTGGVIKLCSINYNGIKKEIVVPFSNIEKNYFSKKMIDYLI